MSPLFDHAQRLGLALAIGFLVGVERGWKQRDEHDGERAAGVRTYALSGLLGGVTGLLAPLAGGTLAAALALTFCLTFLVFQLRTAVEENDNSATSAIAGIAVFALGAYAALGDPLLAAAAGVAATAMLAFKQALHAWVSAITWSEMRSAVLILVATFIILPLLPPGAADPWGLVNLQTLWALTIAIASVSFAGYVALRLFGDTQGAAVGALVGGLVSSTAVALDLARRVRAGDLTVSSAAAGASLATLTSIGRVAALSAFLSVGLIGRLWPALAAAALVLAAGAAALSAKPADRPPRTVFTSVRSPLDLVSVAWFAGLLGVLTIAANLASRTLGPHGLNAFAATAGLVDVDAVTLAVGALLPTGLPPLRAAEAIALALLANQIFKLGAVGLAGSLAYAVRYGAIVLAAAGVAAAAFMFTGAA